MRLGSLLPSLGDSRCGRCRRPWWAVGVGRAHVTPVANGWGMSPLCERCWRRLGTPPARAPFYEELYASWGGDARRERHPDGSQYGWLDVVWALYAEDAREP